MATAQLSTDLNKSVVRRMYEEALNNGKLDVLDELAAPDYQEHNPFPGQPSGIEGLKARFADVVTGLDPNYKLNQIIAEGDMVVVHWTMTGTHQGKIVGIAPTGRTVTFSGIDIYRLHDGKLAEHWHVIDSLQMLQQLGMIPALPS